ncbi:hypothetical protein Tco_1033575 [Tanacetum coccineum]
MQDLYDRMGSMEIRQEAIERMKYRQSYRWDKYQGVFEHMAEVYSVPLQGAYNPPGYAQPPYDQYYQQYPPSPPQQHGRIILESVENGPLIYPTIEENGVTRPKKYSELSATEEIQADCYIKATNIILHGLPLEVYALERECKLYDEFDKFAYKKGETLRDFYLRFSLLLNDMNIYNMKLEQFQVNTKFLNTLPPEWSKFMTDVKLVRDLHTTNIDQLHAYLGQHEFHANEFRFYAGNATQICLLWLASGSIFWENKGLLFVTTAKGKDICPNSALKQKGKGMIHGLRIKCCWFKLKKMVKFYMRKSWHFWQIQELQKDSHIDRHLLIMLLYQADLIWMHMTFDCEENSYTAKLLVMANLSHYVRILSLKSVEIDHLKQTLSEHLKEKESLMQTVTLLKNEFKKEESRNIDREIALEKRLNS